MVMNSKVPPHPERNSATLITEGHGGGGEFYILFITASVTPVNENPPS